MKISDLIAELKAAQRTYGDHSVTTWDGTIKTVRVDPCHDGILSSTNGIVDTHETNELSIEFKCE